MRTTILTVLAASLILALAWAGGDEMDQDPYLWLEDVTGETALDWVRARNAVSMAALEATPGFEDLRADLLAILDSDARIPFVGKVGAYYYNYWRDKNNPRGLWRRTSLAEYRQADPTWEIVLDLDKLAKDENENWVWAGSSHLPPDYTRCLISLSRGGADATVSREFDLVAKQFVAGGFYRPEAKGGMSWIDRDHVYIQSDFGEGSLTTSGYPRVSKLWRRGTPLSEATVVYEGRPDDMSVSAYHDHTPGFERDFVLRALAFYNSEVYLRGEDGALTRIDVPNSASPSTHREWLTVELRDAWTVGGRTFPAGALLAIRFDDFMAGARNFEILFEPTPTTSLAGYNWTLNHLILNVMDDVKNRLYVLTPGKPGWARRPFAGAPAFGSVGAWAVDDRESDAYWMTNNDFLTPTTLCYGEIDGSPTKVKEMPAFFDASDLEVSQHFATSQDGTRVPYFMVAPKNLAHDGENPTLLYGYGGFEISMTPSYSALAGRGWLRDGGVYVIANIRGGGEYGPSWHQAALKANRGRAFEDFAAVAEDLFARKVTSPRRLGIQGGSNGGLLVGNMLTWYPTLCAAVVCQVPLLDMKRYNKLLAGASWMAEYGNPDLPEEWEFIRTFSPYHNVRAGESYPAVLFTTSTRDDRVHPGHARKMMALMEAYGHDVLYYENIEGGHGGAANNEQSAYMRALAFAFLKDRLF
jgi:prolyl oligopeptidase